MAKAKKKTARDYEAMLIKSVGEAVEIAQGKRAPARMYSMPMTARKAAVQAPPAFDRGTVYRVRARLGVSQAVMAKLLNVSAPTVRSWEQGGRKPAGAAVRLLEIAATHPQVVLNAARAKRPGRRQRTA